MKRRDSQGDVMSVVGTAGRNQLIRIGTIGVAAGLTALGAYKSIDSVRKLGSDDPKVASDARKGLALGGALTVLAGVGLIAATRSYRASHASLTDAVASAHQLTRDAANAGKALDAHIYQRGGLMPGFSVHTGTSYVSQKLGVDNYVARVDYDGAVKLVRGATIERSFPIDSSPKLKQAYDKLTDIALERYMLYRNQSSWGGWTSFPINESTFAARAREAGVSWSRDSVYVR